MSKRWKMRLYVKKSSRTNQEYLELLRQVAKEIEKLTPTKNDESL